MNEAIKLAIANGYKGNAIPVERMPDGAITQDPHFWVALGKALGWDTLDEIADAMGSPDVEATWLQNAKDYFELILTGGDTEKFWKKLLN